VAAYFLFDNVEIHDREALARYAEQASKLVAEHGGRYLAAAVAPEVVEDDPGLTSVVLIEFPDAESARAWYESPAYEPLKQLRRRAVHNTAVLIDPAAARDRRG
jgi:uncharacterized protein (DUF1330 family)